MLVPAVCSQRECPVSIPEPRLTTHYSHSWCFYIGRTFLRNKRSYLLSLADLTALFPQSAILLNISNKYWFLKLLFYISNLACPISLSLSIFFLFGAFASCFCSVRSGVGFNIFSISPISRS